MSNSRSEFRVLCLDGGGMRGAYAAALLAGLERDLGPVADNFDLVCGTSTGGLIALGIGAGKTGKEMVDFYQHYGQTIFPQRVHQRLPNLARRLMRKHQYPNKGLKAAVQSIFGNKRMKDSVVNLCIPTVDFVRCTPWVFKTDHGDSLSRDGDVLMRDVALATSAAPMFFPIATAHVPSNGANHRFVDGGLWANSPILVGLTESLRFFVGDGKPYSSLRILSIGLPSEPSGNCDTDRYAPLLYKHPFKIFPLVFQLLDLAMSSQVKSAHFTAKQIGSALPFPCSIFDHTPASLTGDQARHIRLDGTSPQAISSLIQLGSQDAQNLKLVPEIVAFFQARQEAMANG